MDIGILTVSDTCHRGEKVDTSGQKLETLLMSGSILKTSNVFREIVPDEKDLIKAALLKWCDVMPLNIIFTTGGTGFSPRDITPEVVKDVVERETPGLSVHMICQSLAATPYAMLSRPFCGIRGKTLIVTFPGSSKASQECLSFIAPSLQHAFELLNDSHKEVQKTHRKLQEEEVIMPQSAGCLQSLPKSKAVVVAVSRRDRKSPFPLISVEEAQKTVLEEAYVMATKTMKASESYGYVVADDIRSHLNLPPFAASIKDGYAVIAADGPGPRKVIGTSTAGISESNLPQVTTGWCMRINTGAPLPSGADAVVQVEDTELTQTSEDGTEEIEIKILTDPEKGQDIRPEGSDIHRDELLIEDGLPIDSAGMGIMASGGVEMVNVHSKPVVALLSTGNEIQDATVFPLKKDHIYDSNKVTLKCLLEAHGYDVIDGGVAPDDTTKLLHSITNAFRTADILVTTGGVSMGEKDLLRPVLTADFGAKIHFARVFMKPGKPTTFATCEFEGRKKLILGLPGNPVSAIVTSYLYLIPLCKKMSGFANYKNTSIKVKLSEDTKLDPRPEYQRCVLNWSTDDGIPEAFSTGNQISSRLLSMSSAQVLLQLPCRSESLKSLAKGTIVSALLLQ